MFKGKNFVTWNWRQWFFAVPDPLCFRYTQLEKDQFWSWQDFDFIFQLKIQPLAPHFFFLVGEEDDHDQSEALE